MKCVAHSTGLDSVPSPSCLSSSLAVHEIVQDLTSDFSGVPFLMGLLRSLDGSAFKSTQHVAFFVFNF